MQQHPARASSQIANVQGEHHENRECFGRTFTSRVLVLAPASPARPASHGVRPDRPHHLRRGAGARMAELELGHGRSRRVRRNANTGAVSIAVTRAGLVGALPAVRRRASRHPRLSEFHVLCPRRNRRRTDLPGRGRHRRHRPARLYASHRPPRVRGRKSRCRSPRSASDNRADVSGFWIQQGSGVDDAHVLRRHRRAGVRRSAHAAAAGQRHGHLPGFARQRLEQLELGLRQHRRARRRYTPDPARSPSRPMPSRRCICSTPPCPPTPTRA